VQKLKQEIRIGVVCIARKTFDYEAAEKIYKEIQSDLKKIENIDWEIIPELLIEIEETQIYSIDGKEYEINILTIENNQVKFKINGET